MARDDMVGLFWDDTPPPKIIKEKKKCVPPSPVWLSDTHLPYLTESLAFNVPLFTEEDFYTAYHKKEELIFDIECYENYFLIAFKSLVGRKVCYFEMSYGGKLDIEGLRMVVENFTLVSFNGNNYDIPILTLALAGKDCATLKRATNDLIEFHMRPHDVLKAYKVKKLRNVDHIDLIEVAPLSATLKLYAGRLHCHKMQDLPFPPDRILNPQQIAITRFYCVNDLDNTILLRESLNTELELRKEMSDTYGVDLRSKSDAQIAEAVIGGEIRKVVPRRIHIPPVEVGKTFYYKAPSFIQYQSPLMQWVKQLIETTPYIVGESGKMVLPDVIKAAPIKIGNMTYQLGNGGLHSTEKSQAFKSDENFIIKDVDVESFYPRIILNLGLFPEQLTRMFLRVYDQIVESRIAAKKNKLKKIADSLKIVINGSFGKFGSRHSILYSPFLVLMTTITGQLSLLMLIERIEMLGIQVISANTDGVVSYIPRHLEAAFDATVKQWEAETRFKMEETVYDALYSRDVNNYIAIKTDGTAKLKGAYSNHWNDNSTFRLHKNPTNLICIDAVVDSVVKGVPIEETIKFCNDITKFISVRDVKGGGVKLWPETDLNPECENIEFLGKSIRWYYANGVEGDIVYAKTGNKVPRSDGAKPLMQLPDRFPEDINYEWYITEANKILEEIGAC